MAIQHRSNPINLAAALLAALATAAVIFALGRATESVQQHGMLLAGASAGGLVGLWFGLRRAPGLRAWSIGGVVATLAVAIALGGLLSRPTEANEQVISAEVDGREPAGMAQGVAGAMAKDEPAAMAKDAAAPKQNVLLAKGSIEPLAHAGSGTASLIRAADGRNVLTLTGFSSDAGPDLQVWLVAGNPKDDGDVEGGRYVNLGKLKGTSGDQQYVLPKDVDPSEFTHAYVWCRAFSVGFSRAKLA